MNWPDRRICDLLGVEHPIVQAPMHGSVGPVLAAAVSNSGALGSLGFGIAQASEVDAAFAEMRSRTNAPFNLNFFVLPVPGAIEPEAFDRLRSRLRPYYETLGAGEVPDRLPAPTHGFADELVDLLLALRPPVVSFHFGLPDSAAMDRLRAADIRMICSATNVAEAVALEAAGIDAIIAQGWEAGGHRGSHIANGPGDGVGTIALVPQIVDAVRVPVIAAGGIGDGRGIAAAFALGASGVQMGTAFLSCPEATTDARRRQLLRQAQDTDTMVTDAISGRAARAARSRYAVEVADLYGTFPPYPSMYALSDPIETAGAALPDAPVSFHLYGQAAALNRELPASDLVRMLVVEAEQCMSRVAQAVAG